MPSASLSKYPTEIDSFKRISDLTEEILSKYTTYKELIDSASYTEALEFLESNQDLMNSSVGAELINKLSDAIVNIEIEADNIKNSILELNSNLVELNNHFNENKSTVNNEITQLKNISTTLQSNIITDDYNTEKSVNYRTTNSYVNEFTFDYYGSKLNSLTVVPDGNYNNYLIPGTGWRDSNFNLLNINGKEYQLFSAEGVVISNANQWKIIGEGGENPACFSSCVDPYSINGSQNKRFLAVKVPKDVVVKRLRGIIRYTTETY